ncbi:hypothetical protein K461DRAFT_292666 [Myriangium duriaei CBS 260.36]|uniref:GDS1 winged helix domain-containing protein n=1 Tax=Myriangium duriaei CBS 260.36 TaxID=1168546 RepID=A0A9P4J5S3_9PEZI|nr:hypothetical protein K461DRAFT_292666 [Myriangium duriaei CBS 260.36]
MPYNTRRKSLSLSELGVHIPKRARAPSHPATPALPSTDAVKDSVEPPLKKARCVPQFVSPPGSMSPPKTVNIRIKTEDLPQRMPHGAEHTPPPSPGSTARGKVDVEGIKDEVVVGAIIQLEKTGNRPHTSKELAAALATTVPTIESSTNPNALIQARLATYLKGPWPLMSPCPIGKEQENVHPRRVFYFLTCMPHQPIPDTTSQHQQQQHARRVISPSLSSASDEEMEARYARERAQLSPSPEVDLSSPELDEDNDVELASMYSSRSSLSNGPSSGNLSHNRRAASPPLEREERDFKQTANQLQQQRRDSQQKSRQASEADAKIETTEDKASPMVIDLVGETEDSVDDRNREEAAALFGGHDQLHVGQSASYDMSSPVLRPQNPVGSIDAMLVQVRSTNEKEIQPADLMVMSIEKDDQMGYWADWEHIKSPENIELDELEDLFDAY